VTQTNKQTNKQTKIRTESSIKSLHSKLKLIKLYVSTHVDGCFDQPEMKIESE